MNNVLFLSAGTTTIEIVYTDPSYRCLEAYFWLCRALGIDYYMTAAEGHHHSRNQRDCSVEDARCTIHVLFPYTCPISTHYPNILDFTPPLMQLPNVDMAHGVGNEKHFAWRLQPPDRSANQIYSPPYFYAMIWGIGGELHLRLRLSFFLILDPPSCHSTENKKKNS